MAHIKRKINRLLEQSTIVLAYIEDKNEVPLRRSRMLCNCIKELHDAMQEEEESPEGIEGTENLGSDLET